MNNKGLLILDACCLINLSVSGKLEEILNTIEFRCLVSKTVHDDEMPRFMTPSTSTNRKQYDQIAGSNLLKIVDFKGKLEIEKFIFYCRIIGGDGEAACLAIAESNNYLIATDDKRAQLMTKKYAPHVEVITTLDIVKSWADLSNVSQNKVSIVLRNIKNSGRYYPTQKHHLYKWWSDNY